MKLKDKKVIVTGASKNIGAGIALKFAKEGGTVLIHYNSDEKGALETKDRIDKAGGTSFILQGDLSTSAGVETFAGKAIDRIGGVDVLVNCAAGYDTSHFLKLKGDTMRSILSIGAVGSMELMQKVATSMITTDTKGSIINISSVSGFRAYPNRSAHGTAKAALNMLTQTAALDLGERGIRVNAICPGSVPYEGGGDYVTERIPLGRPGKPEDIANAALFLASDDASWITGHLMVVDGGHSLSLA